MSRYHSARGCIKRLGEWIRINAEPEGFTVDAAQLDSLCRINADIQQTCGELVLADRLVYTNEAVGRCVCSICDCSVDDIDRYCRRCGARFAGTRFMGMHELRRNAQWYFLT